jgi:hypothetical protein
MDKRIITDEQLVQSIHNAIKFMDADDLAELANQVTDAVVKPVYDAETDSYTFEVEGDLN